MQIAYQKGPIYQKRDESIKVIFMSRGTLYVNLYIGTTMVKCYFCLLLIFLFQKFFFGQKAF